MTTGAPAAGLFAASTHRARLRRAAEAAAERAVDVLLITPSPDYAYLLGYSAPALERLTCLVAPGRGRPGPGAAATRGAAGAPRAR